MLQVHVDESVDPAAFCFGGYVATPEQWAAFTPEWRKAVDQWFYGGPFKMDEAHHQWSEELQRQRIGYLYDIIQRHAQFGFALTIDVAALAKVMADAPDPRFREPYFVGLHLLISEVARAPQLPFDEPIEFVFDQGRKTRDLLDDWDKFIAGAPPAIRKRIVGEPKFRDDVECVPIQAADMKAWWGRQRFREVFDGATEKRPMRNLRPDIDPVKSVHVAFREAELTRFRSAFFGGPFVVAGQHELTMGAGGFGVFTLRGGPEDGSA